MKTLPAEMVMESGIPIPAQRPRSELGKTIVAMKVGNSFVVTDKHRNALYSHARYYGRKISIRACDDGMIRVWRTK
jgi:hypothetical protein